MEYWEIAHSRLFNHIKSLPVNENTFGPDTTRIFPLIQMGIFGIDQEHKFLTDLFGSKVLESFQMLLFVLFYSSFFCFIVNNYIFYCN